MSVADRARLEAIVVDRNSPQKHVWRAQIVLLTGDGVGTNEIMRRTGTSKVTVWRWQERFMRAGVAGLVRDKTRPSRIPPLPASVCERTVALTLGDPPGETTHWTAAMMAKAVGISVSSVHRIWRAHGLQPHRAREFKLSRDPDFVSKLRDIVGLYVNPPAHAIVLSLDEKSQIQALDRTQLGLPLKPGRCGTMTHDYKRNGTTTLFAALDVLERQDHRRPPPSPKKSSGVNRVTRAFGRHRACSLMSVRSSGSSNNGQCQSTGGTHGPRPSGIPSSWAVGRACARGGPWGGGSASGSCAERDANGRGT